ncbi:MAG: shikimate kinase AroK [Thiotrichales bacterium]|nr:shikimate kinase AroK [Thiotrichales bacterium]
MNAPENIFLVGPMGAGKSTTGRQLAKALGKQFIDSDKEIEASTGAGIPLIFELEGESGFRKRETAMLKRLTQNSDIVLATGGGSVLSEHNRGLIMSCGFVIYLYAPVDFLVQRTARDRNRPLLHTADPRTRLVELLDARGPLYEQVADLIISTENRSTRYVVKEIVKKIASL